MNLAEPFDVIVVGAGPAGASAAYHLASRGRRVLVLDRRRFPRDKVCGDGLTRPAVALLSEMGVLESLAGAQMVRGMRAYVGGRGGRDFDYPSDNHGLVIPRIRLDAALCRHAAAAGARFAEEASATDLLVEDGTVRGVRVAHQGSVIDVFAPAVVVANGSGSRLAERAGIVAPSGVRLGVAIRAYRSDVEGLEDLLEIHAPLVDPGAREVLPSYGWIFPIGPRAANVGVGVFEPEPRTNVRHLMRRLLAQLEAAGRLRPGDDADWRGAPLRFDFAPGRCAGAGFVLAGDAAGMVSPFSGEGISYALESGRLAAEVIDRNLVAGAATCPGLDEYALLLGNRYTGYFEAGRESARRYRLAWRVLDATFDSERPLFQIVRRAALFPEGVGQTYASRVIDDVAPLVPHGELRVREDLLAVGETLIDTVRRDWPFLGRAAAMGRGDPGIPFRPALLLLLSAAFGDPRAPGLIDVGAAVELGYLAALAQISVEDEPHVDGAPPNWGNAVAIMVGDFLLARAYQIAASHDATVTGLMAAAMKRASEGRARELRHAFDLDVTRDEHLAIVERKTATLFELPCQLGARLAGVSPQAAIALARYGRRLGIAYQLADDALALRGEAGSLGRASGSDLGDGVYGLAILTAAQSSNGQAARLRELLSRRPLADATMAAGRLVSEAGGIEDALALAERYARQARTALAPLPEGPARATLAGLSRYVVTRRLN